MDFLRRYKKNKIIRSYIRKLPRLLVCEFERKQKFSPKEVISIVKKYSLNEEYVSYACSIFCTKREFNSYKGINNLKWSYNSLRQEVGDKFFGGDLTFNIIFPKNNLQHSIRDSKDIWRL